MNVSELLAVLAILFVFIGIGAGSERIFCGAGKPWRFQAVFGLVTGWAFLSLLGVFAALGNFGTTVLLVLTMAGGGILFILFCLKDKDFRRTVSLFGVALLLLSPLLWFAAATPATIFDEFGQWLPNARFLYEHGHFPTASEPNEWSFKPGYPPAMPIIIAAGSMLAHGFGETIGKLSVIALGAGFGMILAGIFAPRFGRWPALVAGVAFATLLNPFFDPRISLTSYADTPTGFVLALAIFAAWNALQTTDAVWRWRAAACSVLLILLRETNIVLIAGLCIAIGMLIIAGKRPGAKEAIAAIAAPATISLLAWRLYLQRAEILPAMVVRPAETWDWHAPNTLLHTLFLDRLYGNPLIGGAAALCFCFALPAAWLLLRRSAHAFGGLLFLFGSVSIIWLAFLTFAYIAVFWPSETARAASVWRYVSQLGPSLILVLGAMSANASTSLQGERNRPVFVCCAAFVMIAFQFATWRYWRIDCRYADVVSARHIARGLSSASIGNAPLTIVNPVDAAAYAVQLDYDLHRPAGRSQGVSTLDEAATDGLILDLTPIDRATAYAARQSPSVLLLRRMDGGLIQVLAVPEQPIEGACHIF